MKKFILTFLFLATIMPLWSYDFKSDGIYYTILSSTDKTVEVAKGKDGTNYNGHIIIPESVTYNNTEYAIVGIGTSAFSKSTGLLSVKMGNSITYISDYAFNECSGLLKVELSDNITTFGKYSFYKCKALTVIDLPASTTTLGIYMLYGCNGLTSVNIPKGITVIPDYFISLSYIESAIIPEGVTEIGEGAFAYCRFESLDIPQTVTTIKDKAFMNSLNNNIILPENLVSLGNSAFNNCYFTEIRIPEKVTTIGASTFQDCLNLKTVYLPASITLIGAKGFYNAPLKSLYCYAELPPALEGSDVFSNEALSDCDLYVYGESVAFYENANPWKYFDIKSLEINATSISLDQTTASINPGETITLTATVLPDNASDKSVVWSSSDESIATVDNGVVIAVAPGVATITATTVDGTNLSATCEVEVLPILVASISLDKTRASIALGETVTLTATVLPDNATDKSVTWSSSDETIATVDNGVVTAVAPGVATITATTVDGTNLSATCEITISSELEIGSTFVVDGITYKKTADAEVAVIAGETKYSGDINIPANVKYDKNYAIIAIADSAFNECDSLIRVNLPDGLKEIGIRAFNKCINLENVSLPTSLTKLSTGAFANCTQLKTITVPSAVTVLNNVVFSNCSALRQITILGEITAIKNSALQNCINLTEIVIPKSVTSIEANAFFGCLTLSKVVVESETPPTANSTSFNNLPTDAILYVPNKDAMNLYREATGWNTFTKMRVVDVVDFEPGDANCDNSLSVTDVVMLANAIMGENSNEFNEFAADANCDGVISVSDIVCTATVIMSGTELANTSQASIMPFNVQKTSLSVNDVAIARGETKQINIKLNNAIDFTAFQVDIELPNGLTIENSSLSLQGNSSHILYANEIEENMHRFMSFSMTNEKLNCDNELLLTIDVVANDDFIGGMLNLNNILLVNREGKEFMLKNISSTISSTNSISNTIYNNVNIYAQGKNIVIENTDVENAYIYTIDGAIKIEQLQPGYNVIEMNEMGMYIVKVGSFVEKVMIK